MPRVALHALFFFAFVSLDGSGAEGETSPCEIVLWLNMEI